MNEGIAMNHPNFRIVLVEPEIPQNTGNIGRTCVGTQSELHLIEPFGFEISDKNLKRAGLDYWQYLKWYTHPNLQSWIEKVENWERVFFFSTKASKSYFEIDYKSGDSLVFGRETKGLPKELQEQFPEKFVQSPQYGPIRSLNVATAAAIALYEGLRQIKPNNNHAP
jgi:tRNA (cytidine/uridine-2'-O-)-methyltransferase